ncbi:MAG: DUF4337 family protein [Verrucomicrobiota bacterium]
MKTQLPEELKKDLPQTTYGKILMSTPVVMTVVATLLAGLASSEMTRAQYDRSLAAQLQSKAGDQWGYFQSKKLRGALQHNSLELLRSTVAVRPLDAAALGTFGELDAASRAALLTGELPALPPAAVLSEKVKAALDALETEKPESEITVALAPVKAAELDKALAESKARVAATDAAFKPVNQVFDRIEKQLASAPSSDELPRNFTAARLRYMAARYDAEARLNQQVASIYELQVRQGNHSAERHHQRSGKFFYGMLAAQAAVIVSTFAMAARQRNLLWTLAAAAGLAAVIFAVYVYLYL